MYVNLLINGFLRTKLNCFYIYFLLKSLIGMFSTYKFFGGIFCTYVPFFLISFYPNSIYFYIKKYLLETIYIKKSIYCESLYFYQNGSVFLFK